MNLTSEAIPEMLNVEVHQIAQAAACYFKICDQLGLIQGIHLFNCLKFKNDLSLHPNIEPQPSFYKNILIFDRDCHLCFSAQTQFFNLISQTSLIDRFQQAWPKCAMNGICCVEHFFANIIYF